MFKFGLPTLVLRQFSINEAATSDPAIEITGRASGFTQWLLTAMKLSTLTTFRLQGDELSVVSGGLSGETHTVIPVSAIESTQCGFSKSMGFLIAGAAFLLLGLLSAKLNVLLMSAVVAAVAFALYYFSNRMFISVSAGDRTETIQYKKGLIDGQSVDLERTLQAIAIVNAAVLDRHRT